MSILNDLKAGFGNHPVGSSPTMLAFGNEQKISRNYKIIFLGGIIIGGVAVWYFMKRRNENSEASPGPKKFQMKTPSKEPGKPSETYSSFSGELREYGDTTKKKSMREKRKEEYFKSRNKKT